MHILTKDIESIVIKEGSQSKKAKDSMAPIIKGLGGSRIDKQKHNSYISGLPRARGGNGFTINACEGPSIGDKNDLNNYVENNTTQ